MLDKITLDKIESPDSELLRYYRENDVKPPSKAAIDGARKVIELTGIEPSLISPSPDDGIFLEYVLLGYYILIEFCDDPDEDEPAIVLFVRSPKEVRQGYDYNTVEAVSMHFEALVNEIKREAELNAG